MSDARSLRQVLFALTGILVLLVTVALSAATIRPTEATWQDVVHGESRFGTHPNAGKNYARAISGNGTIQRTATASSIGPARAFADPSAPAVERPLEVSNSGALGVLPISMDGNSCATVRPEQAPYCDVGENLPPGTSAATSEMSYLRLWAAAIRSIENVAYGSDSNGDSITATATCVPGESGKARVTADGPILLRGSTALYLPPPNHQTSAFDRTPLTVLGIRATLQYHHSEEPGWARAEARLYVRSNDILANWTTHIVLASAECGIARDASGEPQRPTTSRPADLPEAANQPASIDASNPILTSFASDVELGPLGENAADESLADSEADFETEDTGAEVSAKLPTLDDAAMGDAGPATPGPAEPTNTTEKPEPHLNEVKPGATDPAVRPTASPAEPAASGSAQNKPPQAAAVGRWFALANHDGVELGAAKIEDLVRTPGCGVEIALTIDTSTEEGPDRWASIDYRDFAEVSPGGSTRPAQRANSECVRLEASRPAELTAGGTNEVVIVIQISDTADRAMLRPEGTAGWVFDLPPLTRVATTSSPATAPSATAGPTATPSAPMAASTTDIAEA